jgi:hypothetical protein
LDVLQNGVATSQAIACVPGAVIDPVELPAVSPGSSVFGYDPATGEYQFNWSTNRAWAGTCRRLLVRLDDGTLHTAEFRLR